MIKKDRRILKYIYVVVAIFLIDYCGVLKHIFELNYERYFEYPLKGDVLKYAHDLRANKTTVTPINTYNHTYVHTARGKCKSENAPRLVLLIKSAIGNRNLRDAIRRTWGYEQRFSDVLIQRVFLLGWRDDEDWMQDISNEAALNDDIVQSDFIDSYFNNTIKTMMGLRWALEYCANSEHFMFVDDDYYVSLKNVLRFIAQPSTYYPNVVGMKKNRILGRKLFAGFVFQTAPHRHKFSKWYVSLQEYPYDMWPPYVTAGAFILSYAALSEMYYVSQYTAHFRFDDVFLGIVALKAKIQLTHCEQFYFHRPIYNGPESYRHLIASHEFADTIEMERVWNECHSAGFA